VSGLSLVGVAHIPGNVLEGNWRQVVYVDDAASEEQSEALLAAFSGQLGGPLADLAELVGERVAIERASIKHELSGGAGKLTVGTNGDSKVYAEMHPYVGPDGSTTTLNNSVFSTVPGSPAWIGKASLHRVDLPRYGMSWEYDGKNAIQSEWKIEYAA
jgi:hypothetical protein